MDTNRTQQCLFDTALLYFSYHRTRPIQPFLYGVPVVGVPVMTICVLFDCIFYIPPYNDSIDIHRTVCLVTPQRYESEEKAEVIEMSVAKMPSTNTSKGNQS